MTRSRRKRNVSPQAVSPASAVPPRSLLPPRLNSRHLHPLYVRLCNFRTPPPPRDGGGPLRLDHFVPPAPMNQDPAAEKLVAPPGRWRGISSGWVMGATRRSLPEQQRTSEGLAPALVHGPRGGCGGERKTA